MANFNKTVQKGMDKTTNHEGATVHQLNALESMFSRVLGSFFGEGTFYEKRTAISDLERLLETMQDVSEKDKEYILKVAELGRYSNMIEYPLQILALAYNDERFKGQHFLSEDGRNKLAYYNEQIVRRTKDVNAILSTHFALFGEDRPLPMQMRKQLKSKLEQYDKYKLSKGLDSSKTISLRDSIKLLRPTPANEEMAQFFKDIIENNVTLGDGKKQIQTELTRQGQEKTEQSKKDLREALYKANLQALLKHLVNLYKNDVFEDENALQFAVNKIRDEQTVLSSKLLPFRFYSAYKAISTFGNNRAVVKLREAIEDALDISVANVDDIDGTTAVLVDRSASMRFSNISKYSSVNGEEMALLLGAIAYKKGSGDLFMFSNDAKRVDVSRRTPVLDMVNMMKQVSGMGGGTDLRNALDFITAHATDNNVSYDNLIILSDNDCYGYNESTNTLTFGEGHYWGFYGRNRDDMTADKHIDSMIKDGIIRKAWINNLFGNDFAIANTKSSTKNLITGFSEKFINAINIYNYLGSGKDIRKVIDLLLEKEKESIAKAKAKKKRR